MPAVPEPQDWLRAWAKIQRLADRDTLRMLDVALKDVRAQIKRLQQQSKGAIGETVRIYQLKAIEANMLRQQAILWNNLGDMIMSARLDAAAAAIQLNNAVLENLFASAGQAALGKQLAQTIEFGLLQTIDVAVTRMTQSAFPLAQRIYRSGVALDGRISAGINSALLRGLSAREFAAEAVDWFNPGTPGGARYAAMRLARTEINNAFHAMAVNSADHPWVKGMQWHLSRSHPKPDECDELARKNPDHLGEGVYKVKNVPRKPHPHCFCFVTPVVMDEDEFLDDLVGGKFDKHIDGILAGQTRPALRKGTTSKSALQAQKEKVAAERAAEKEAQRIEREKAAKERAARLAASPAGRRAAARLHTDRLVDRDVANTPAVRNALKSVMRDADNLAPESMLRLRMFHDTIDEMWERSGGPNVGGFYTYGRTAFNMDHNDIHLNPAWHTNFAQQSESFLASQRGGWLTKSYEDDGMKATIGHELGHHIDKMATGGTGQWPSSVGRELSAELGKLIGAPGPDLSTFNDPGSITAGSMINWVAANKLKIEKSVSRYAAKSPQELMAEIWNAFASGNPKTPPGMKRIGRLMARAAEEKMK